MTIDPGFSTGVMTEIFSPAARVALFRRFEAELAAAQAAVGLVPVAIAEEIARVCAQPSPDPMENLSDGWEVGSPIIPVLDEIRADLDDDSARWLHHGATTQDVVDTALVLQMKSGLDVIDSGLATISDSLAALADEHRGTVMMGRTFLQAAVPTTFGARAALWLDPLIRHRADLDRAVQGLPVQLGGPVGDLSSFGPNGIRLVEELAGRLGLAVPVAPWHTDRSPITEVVGLVQRIAASMEKIATDLALLAQSSVDEIRVRGGGSSSMPHKSNPIDAIRAIAAAEACLSMAAGVTAGRHQELERGLGGWQLEWLMVPLAFQTAGASVEAMARCLGSLEVDRDRMRANAGTDQIADDTGTDSVSDGGIVDRVLEAWRHGQD